MAPGMTVGPLGRQRRTVEVRSGEDYALVPVDLSLYLNEKLG